MKKPVKYGLILIALCLLFYECKNRIPENCIVEPIEVKQYQVKKGLYVYEKDGDPAWSWIKLDDDNKFVFHRGVGLSYRPEGEYEVDGNKLYLKTHDLGTYEFQIDDNKLIYVKSQDEAFDSIEMVFFYTTKSLEDMCHWNEEHGDNDNQPSKKLTTTTFIDNVANMRGSIEITPKLREAFNVFARKYRWIYLPDMDGYESFFEMTHYANSFGYPNFADAVFYVLQYLDEQMKISSDDMQSAIYSLFAAKKQYKPMVHQNYPKLAIYENGYYSRWPEGGIDHNREFYLLTDLNIKQKDNDPNLIYITVRLKNYYFEDTSLYEAGELEKWLLDKAQKMGCKDLDAAAELIANGEICELPGLQEWETTMMVNTGKNTSSELSTQFLYSRSRWIK